MNNPSDYREAYNIALETAIGGLIACRDKVGISWQDRMKILVDVGKLIPLCLRGAVYLGNTER